MKRKLILPLGIMIVIWIMIENIQWQYSFFPYSLFPFFSYAISAPRLAELAIYAAAITLIFSFDVNYRPNVRRLLIATVIVVVGQCISNICQDIIFGNAFFLGDFFLDIENLFSYLFSRTPDFYYIHEMLIHAAFLLAFWILQCEVFCRITMKKSIVGILLKPKSIAIMAGLGAVLTAMPLIYDRIILPIFDKDIFPFPLILLLYKICFSGYQVMFFVLYCAFMYVMACGLKPEVISEEESSATEKKDQDVLNKYAIILCICVIGVLGVIMAVQTFMNYQEQQKYEAYRLERNEMVSEYAEAYVKCTEKFKDMDADTLMLYVKGTTYKEEIIKLNHIAQSIKMLDLGKPSNTYGGNVLELSNFALLFEDISPPLRDTTFQKIYAQTFGIPNQMMEDLGIDGLTTGSEKSTTSVQISQGVKDLALLVLLSENVAPEDPEYASKMELSYPELGFTEVQIEDIRNTELAGYQEELVLALKEYILERATEYSSHASLV